MREKATSFEKRNKFVRVGTTSMQLFARSLEFVDLSLIDCRVDLQLLVINTW